MLSNVLKWNECGGIKTTKAAENTLIIHEDDHNLKERKKCENEKNTTITTLILDRKFII